jgi:heme o synthase
MLLLVLEVNLLTAVLTFASLLGYAMIYTAWLRYVIALTVVTSLPFLMRMSAWSI